MGKLIFDASDLSRHVGAVWIPGKGTHLRLWAPHARKVEVEWVGESGFVALKNTKDDCFSGFFPEKKPGARYWFRLNKGNRIPDPASRYQPEGIYGPSEVVAHEFGWTDGGWKGIPMESWVIYEIHTGAFSRRGNFDSIVDDLPRLRKLGVTVLEIMPVAQFPGERNWGYDGVFPNAVQNTYGGPAALKNLVDACHKAGLAVVLDVVYNHLGPEGNVFTACGPYINEKYKTPWGGAINFDGPQSDQVRKFFLQNAWQWLVEYHFDGLRLDAIDRIFDRSSVPFLEDLSRLKKAAERTTGRTLVLIGEQAANDSRVLAPVEKNGLGLDGQWSDDFHHTLHATLTGECKGYYIDYQQGTGQLAHVYKNGVYFEGRFSRYHQRLHGRSYEGVEKRKLVAQAQNHDQIGNRADGQRLSSLVDFEKTKLAAACVFLSPFLPLVFMGEEHGSQKPFYYFIDYHDPKLLEAARKNRMEEWKSFKWKNPPPDPAARQTFESCVLDKKTDKKSIVMQEYMKNLIGLSKVARTKDLNVHHDAAQDLVVLEYGEELRVLLSFDGNPVYKIPHPERWDCILESSAFRPGRKPEKRKKAPRALRLPSFSATVLQRRRQ